jgi:predicted kinase
VTDLSRKRDRERLKPSHEPYWQRLDKGRYSGFRRAKVYAQANKAAEKWLVQAGAAPVLREKLAAVDEG